MRSCLPIIALLAALCDSGLVMAMTRDDGPSRPAEAAPVGGRLALVRARGTLLVCAGTDLFAMSWRNERNGELEGLDNDMARAFATQLGVRATFLETAPAALMRVLEEGRCDVAMGGVGITAGRAARVAFTKPYLAAPLAAVTSRSSGRIRGWADVDRRGMIVAVASGTVAEEVMRDGLRQAQLVAVASPETPEGELQSGRADAFVTDYSGSRRLRGEDAWRVIDAPRSFGETLYGYAAPRGDAAWLAEVNGFLARVRGDGTMARSAQRWGLAALLAP